MVQALLIVSQTPNSHRKVAHSPSQDSMIGTFQWRQDRQSNRLACHQRWQSNRYWRYD